MVGKAKRQASAQAQMWLRSGFSCPSLLAVGSIDPFLSLQPMLIGCVGVVGRRMKWINTDYDPVPPCSSQAVSLMRRPWKECPKHLHLYHFVLLKYAGVLFNIYPVKLLNSLIFSQIRTSRNSLANAVRPEK